MNLYMEHFYTWMERSLGLSEETSQNLLQTVVIIVLLLLINRLIRYIIFIKSKDVQYRYRLMKSQDYIIFFIGFILVIPIWIQEFKSMATFFGLFGAGVAIALREPVSDLAGWFFIVWRKPFVVGDRIQIGENAGDVIDIRIFQFTIIEIGNWVDADQSTGRIMHIPNSHVFKHSLANYSTGFNYIWNEIHVLITFESNWQKAKEILTEIVNEKSMNISKIVEKKIKEASMKYMIFYKNLTPIVYTSVKNSGVQLTMRFLCDPRRRRGYSESIWEAVLTEFAKHDDIDFAYPTTRFYNNATEGKPGTKPPSSPAAESPAKA